MVDYTGHAISFVVPALNEELLIGRCIHAINREVERTGITAEVIVVDNGSTDSTQWVAMVKGARVVNENRRGIQSAKARGFKESRYPVVATIDADCMIREGWVTRVIKAFADPSVAAVSGPYRYYDIRWVGRYLTNTVFIGMAALAQHMPLMMGGNSAFRRHALEQCGGFNSDFTFWGEDTYISLAISKVGRVKFDPLLRVDSSGRRLIEQGYVQTFLEYMKNMISVRLSGRAATKEYKNFR